MAKLYSDGIKEAILAAFGRQYVVELPSGKTDSITAKINLMDKHKRTYYTATIGEPIPNGSIIIADSRRFEVTNQREGDTLTKLTLVQESAYNDPSEY